MNEQASEGGVASYHRVIMNCDDADDSAFVTLASDPFTPIWCG